MLRRDLFKFLAGGVVAVVVRTILPESSPKESSNRIKVDWEHGLAADYNVPMSASDEVVRIWWDGAGFVGRPESAVRVLSDLETARDKARMVVVEEVEKCLWGG